MDTGIVTIFALCEARTRATYQALWGKLLELCPALRETVRHTMSDFEQATLGTLQETFPNSEVHGCWFHFKQAVLRKWRSLGLNHAPREVLTMTMSLPLAPADRFHDGLAIISDLADNIAEEYPAIISFIVYVRRTWVSRAALVSVYTSPLRTNNFVEAFHGIAWKKLGGTHPNIWIFLYKLRDLIKDEEINFSRLQHGIVSREVRRSQFVARDKAILKAQTALTTGRLSLHEFLRSFNRFQDNYTFQELARNAEVDNNEFDPPTADVEDRSPVNQSEVTPEPADTVSDPAVRVPDPAVRVSEPAEEVSVQARSTLRDQEQQAAQPLRRGRRRCRGRARSSPNAEDQSTARAVQPAGPERRQNVNSRGDASEGRTTVLRGSGDSDGGVAADHRTSADPMPSTSTGVMENDGNRSQGGGVCCVCLCLRATHVFVPCGHLCLCAECLPKLKRKTCPVCRARYDMVVKTIST